MESPRRRCKTRGQFRLLRGRAAEPGSMRRQMNQRSSGRYRDRRRRQDRGPKRGQRGGIQGAERLGSRKQEKGRARARPLGARSEARRRGPPCGGYLESGYARSVGRTGPASGRQCIGGERYARDGCRRARRTEAKTKRMRK